MCFWPRESKARKSHLRLDSPPNEKVMTANGKPFQSKVKYHELNSNTQEIRLATIEPPSLDSAVRVILRNVPLVDVKGKYCCLSYAWGSLEDLMPILVDGNRHQVTCNLYSLLLRLRTLPQGKDIWIDALCIDQQNPVEKQSQVSMMHSIYTNAAEVLIGLDDSRPCSIVDIPAQHTMAETTLEGLAKDSHLWKLEYFVTQSWSARPSQEILSSFAQILTSTWFDRTWVVQETCLAKKAVLLFPWGELDWEIFRQAFLNWDKHSRTCCYAFAEKLPDALSQACNRMYLHVQCIIYTRAALKKRDQHILEPMLNYQHLEVKERQDKIYAFRGLHTHSDKPLPEPDYIQSVEATFREFLLWYFKHHQSLYLLGLDMCFEKVEGLPHSVPTWLPTWPTFSIERGNRAKARGKFLQCYQAAPTLQTDFKWEWNPKLPAELRLIGVRVDKVVDRAKAHFTDFTDSKTFPEHVALMEDWYRFAFPDHGAGDIHVEHMSWEFCATMLAGILNERGGSGPRLLDENDNVVLEWKKALIGMKEQGVSYRCSDRQEMVLQSHAVALLDRVLFRTAKGRLGVGPYELRENDELYMLAGGDAPFLLRPSTYEGKHELVGHCFTHGIMQGEIKLEQGGDWIVLV